MTDELRESSSLAILDGTDIVYVAHAPAKRILSISINIGTRDLAFATSLGRVLLAGQDDEWLDNYLATVELPAITPRTINTPDKLRAELMRIRRQGWALVDQELEDGLRAIAAPIHDEHGNVIAAANLAVHASRWSNDAIREHPPPPPPPNHHRHRPRHQRRRPTRRRRDVASGRATRPDPELSGGRSGASSRGGSRPCRPPRARSSLMRQPASVRTKRWR